MKRGFCWRSLQRIWKETNKETNKEANSRFRDKVCLFDVVDALETGLNIGDTRVLIAQAGHTDWVESQIRSIPNSL
jgi:hypothetical protein